MNIHHCDRCGAQLPNGAKPTSPEQLGRLGGTIMENGIALPMPVKVHETASSVISSFPKKLLCRTCIESLMKWFSSAER